MAAEGGQRPLARSGASTNAGGPTNLGAPTNVDASANTGASPRTYTIKEAAALTGLPASTLRYYETVGLTPPIGRGETSGHRIYTRSDIDLLSSVSCLAATGMGIDKMRQYFANGADGVANAGIQMELLRTQDAELEREQRRITARRQYISLKIAYWQAVESGNDDRAEELAEQAQQFAIKLH